MRGLIKVFILIMIGFFLSRLSAMDQREALQTISAPKISPLTTLLLKLTALATPECEQNPELCGDYYSKLAAFVNAYKQNDLISE